MKPRIAQSPRPNATLRLVPPGALKGFLAGRPIDERVTYATYFPKGKKYPYRSKKRIESNGGA